MTDRHHITRVLLAHRNGDDSAFDELVTLVYPELRRIARGQLRTSGSSRLDTTALVHETYLKLADSSLLDARDKAHFFAVVARAMRQIVIDHARHRRAVKRGGDAVHQPLDNALASADAQAERMLFIDEALTQLAELDPRMTRVVECRFFTGLTEQETAAALNLSTRSVQRLWTRARAWLRDILGE